MNIEEYQQERRVTDKYRPEEAPYCHALGVASEAGEYAGKVDKVYRKKHCFCADEDTRRHMALELGDILWFVCGCADDIGYTLEEILDMNIAKLRDRDKRDQICSIEGGDDR